MKGLVELFLASVDPGMTSRAAAAASAAPAGAGCQVGAATAVSPRARPRLLLRQRLWRQVLRKPKPVPMPPRRRRRSQPRKQQGRGPQLPQRPTWPGGRVSPRLRRQGKGRGAAAARMAAAARPEGAGRRKAPRSCLPRHLRLALPWAGLLVQPGCQPTGLLFCMAGGPRQQSTAEDMDASWVTASLSVAGGSAAPRPVGREARSQR